MTAVYMVMFVTLTWLCVSALVAMLLGAVVQAARSVDGGRVRETRSATVPAQPPTEGIG